MSIKQNCQRIKIHDSDVPIILVVEDEEDNLLYLSHALIFLNYNFITASKGQDALDLATKYEIDLILLDLVLPDINGFDLVERLKKNKIAQSMSIIAISALVRKQERDRALKAGCDDYLVKPYFLEELDRKIRQYLVNFSLNKLTGHKGLNLFDRSRFAFLPFLLFLISIRW